VWSFLHAYPFYNSEQSSQRYVKLREPRAFMPPLEGEARDVFEQAVLRAWDAYAELSALLKDDAWAILKDLRYVRPTNTPARLAAVEREAEKKAIETARYVIPIAAFTSMVHTVSGLVLHRLYRMMNTADTPYEARMVIGAMVDLVREVDPLFFEKVGLATLEQERLPEMAMPRPTESGDAFAREFDRRLGGRVSRLRDWSAGAERVVADAVRATFGLTTAELSDGEAIDRVMNPARNPYRIDMLNVSHHSPQKRLSHTADSQDQRHRMVPASRPMLTFADTREPDVVTPRLIRQNPAASAVYHQAIADAWAAKNRLLALGVPLEFALYVLPNAKALRMVESGSFLSLQHKWTLRTCFNAQEEIYLASMDEISQVQAVHPQLARHLGPPCVLRNRIVSPRCTEGTHFCGVPVWQSFPNAERRL
jgi:thymidylate synthase ThyX